MYRSGIPEAGESKPGGDISKKALISDSFFSPLMPRKPFMKLLQECFYELQVVCIFPEHKCHVICLKKAKLLEIEVSYWGCVR